MTCVLDHLRKALASRYIVRLLIVGAVCLPLGCGDPEAPATSVLQPNELCSDYADSAIVTFEDANLESAIRVALSLGAQENLTCGLVSGLTELDADSLGITSLTGIQNLTRLTTLWLRHNSISDISALSGLTSLTGLILDYNSISDISALSGLTSLEGLILGHNSISDVSALSGLSNLRYLDLNNNSITDISPLSGLASLENLGLWDNSISDISALSGLTSLEVLYLSENPNLTDIRALLDNTGLGAGDMVNFESTNVSCTDVAALQAKGVTVYSDCP